MIRILALDLSTNIGWAFGEPSDKMPRWGVWTLPGPELSLGCRFNAFHNVIEDALSDLQPTGVHVEAPIPQQNNAAISGAITLGLHAILAMMIFQRPGIEFDRPTVDKVRNAVIGRSKLTDLEKHQRLKIKPTIVKPWIEMMGWGITQPDAADAAIVWAFAVGIRAPRPPRMRRAA